MKNTTLSVETAAIMKCAEVCEKAAHGVAGAGIFAEAVRALIPQDGRTQLEEFGMKVADRVYGHFGVDPDREQLRAIVTNLIGEKK